MVITLRLSTQLSQHSQRISACISGGNLGLVIDDNLIHYLFPNLKRKYCSEQTLPNGANGAMSMMVTELAVRAASRREVRATPTLLVLLINDSMGLILIDLRTGDPLTRLKTQGKVEATETAAQKFGDSALNTVRLRFFDENSRSERRDKSPSLHKLLL
ncbi:hypothetical protein [Nostoc sp. WHI]|uniref:hypothetical protein n=1 Tax=Nostoc sp. WHI TaxID=2650611 RepID=UPI0018C6C24C|nr:hypothetical protein [Nostoc sp. WHI]MBG1268605.1 hypothetical protein [Nostoc sp. WHI]